ncbi:LysR family transcriptional regulator [Burkholderia sp. Z1]|uniref:LysR family transcriptional regulator n=1 Tax=Burkholderia sp. Z1 TaxID=2759039 RepID=UPI001867C959|nr:LysR substrate-binding domain-containing protein [Burkholderia sp. Z1]
MKYPQVLAFVRAATLGSIRAAARSMDISQAAVTKTIKTLEEDLGVALFSRGVRGATLTAAGASLLPRAMLIVSQMELLPGDIRSDERARVSMGVLPVATALLLPHALPAFVASRPHAPLRIADGFLSSVLPGLRDGSLDFGICAIESDQLTNFFRFEPWFRSRAVVVARRDHPLAGRPCGIGDLVRYGWIYAGSRASVLDLFFNHPRSGATDEPLIIEAQNVTAGIVAVKSTDAISIAPGELAAQIVANPDIVLLQVTDPLPATIVGLLTRADGGLSANALMLVELLRAAMQRIPGLEHC